ncbi:hypothetical protein FKM82_028117 [Ascaphus truei]
MLMYSYKIAASRSRENTVTPYNHNLHLGKQNGRMVGDEAGWRVTIYRRSSFNHMNNTVMENPFQARSHWARSTKISMEIRPATLTNQNAALRYAQHGLAQAVVM